MHIPKNLNCGDIIIHMSVNDFLKGRIIEYSKLKVRRRIPSMSNEKNVTYEIRGYSKIWEYDREVIKIPCDGVVYSSAEYDEVQIIRKEHKAGKKESMEVNL